jgi:hypothetical protein
MITKPDAASVTQPWAPATVAAMSRLAGAVARLPVRQTGRGGRPARNVTIAFVGCGRALARPRVAVALLALCFTGR